MKTKLMPTTLALLFFSWLFAICGLAIGGYFVIFKFNEWDLFFKGLLILFGGLLFSVVTRALANIGEILFDSRLHILRLSIDVPRGLRETKDTLRETKDTLRETINNQLNETKNTLNNQLNETKNTLNNQLQAIMAVFSSKLNDLLHRCDKLSQDINNNSRSCQELDSLIYQSLQETKGALQEGAVRLLQQTKDALNSQLGLLLQETSGIRNNELNIIKSYIEQINCDSKDINQSINQIKVFFEQIERHLDLKK